MWRPNGQCWREKLSIYKMRWINVSVLEILRGCLWKTEKDRYVMWADSALMWRRSKRGARRSLLLIDGFIRSCIKMRNTKSKCVVETDVCNNSTWRSRNLLPLRFFQLSTWNDRYLTWSMNIWYFLWTLVYIYLLNFKNRYICIFRFPK